MWYLIQNSFWRTVLVIALLCLKRCDPQRPGDADGIPPQDILPPGVIITTEPEAGALADAEAQKHRFTTPSTTMKKLYRTTPARVSFEENCDYLAHYCLRAYKTGKVCGRTLYYGYYTFRNYCLLDYINCRESYEVWQIVHMGECFEVKLMTEYLFYQYGDDHFLEQYYIMEEHR